MLLFQTLLSIDFNLRPYDEELRTALAGAHLTSHANDMTIDELVSSGGDGHHNTTHASANVGRCRLTPG